jgi:hypothetical protein
MRGPAGAVMWQDRNGTEIPNVISVHYPRLGPLSNVEQAPGSAADLHYLDEAGHAWRVDVETGVVYPEVPGHKDGLSGEPVRLGYTTLDCTGDEYVHFAQRSGDLRASRDADLPPLSLPPPFAGPLHPKAQSPG